jgi:hypothetical protein
MTYKEALTKQDVLSQFINEILFMQIQAIELPLNESKELIGNLTSIDKRTRKLMLDELKRIS